METDYAAEGCSSQSFRPSVPSRSPKPNSSRCTRLLPLQMLPPNLSLVQLRLRTGANKCSSWSLSAWQCATLQGDNEFEAHAPPVFA